MIDALTALGALLAFLVAYGLHANGYQAAARYVDPVLTLALVVLTVGIPYSLGKGALSELIYVSPPAAEVEPLEGKVRAVLADLPLTALDIRTVRIGRTWEIMAQAQLRPDIDLDAHAADDYREKLAGQFAHERQAVRAVLIFTYLPTEPLT
jgi:predicted Co/Zn/Cd cation transporter (cation efflux family)